MRDFGRTGGGQQKSMTGRERVAAALAFREPDRVPLDIGGTSVTGIALQALLRLLEQRGLDSTISIPDHIQQIGLPSGAVLRALGVDTIRIGPPRLRDVDAPGRASGDLHQLTDPWSVNWQRKHGEHYYSQVSAPLQAHDELATSLHGYRPPAPPDRAVVESVVGAAPAEASLFPLLDRDTAGIFEMSCRLRGLETFCTDLLLDPAASERLADIILEYKRAYWDQLLDVFGQEQVVVAEADDFGSDSSLLISPELIRTIYLPRWRELFDFIKQKNRAAKIFFHSCGAVRPIIADLIACGVDILNPVQYTANGMQLDRLKRDFGSDLVFWGGGIDTKQILPFGTPGEVRDEVRRVIDIMAPGGGFVFATVHNIQADVPVANLEALLQALEDFGGY